MRLGLFGGTFDPPHVGHLLVASDACEALSLDRLVFIPNARQPLKGEREVSASEDRLAMTRLAVGDDPRYVVDACEVERGGTSYSVDTLAVYAQRHSADERFFLVGADVAESFSQWREPWRVATLARLAILRRADGDDARGDATVAAAFAAAVGDGPSPPVVVRTRRVDLSSTEVRRRVRAGQSITGFVPDAVARYIAAHGLYQPRHHQ